MFVFHFHIEVKGGWEPKYLPYRTCTSNIKLVFNNPFKFFFQHFFQIYFKHNDICHILKATLTIQPKITRSILWTKKLLKKHFCSLHWCRLLKILAWRKMCFIFIWNLPIPKIHYATKPIITNIVLCFLHHCKGHFLSLIST
jgi:hypothetical protein